MDKSARILIVDDFPMTRTMLLRSLSSLAFSRLSEASDGLEAWELLDKAVKEKDPYQLVFLDWNMPHMNGIQLMEKCKTVPELASIPIIMISAERDRSNVVRAMKAGANDYILKPFSAEILLEKLNNFLGNTASSLKQASGGGK